MCDKCIYYKFDIDDEPCVSCSKCNKDSEDLHWMPITGYDHDSTVMLKMILETQNKILLELGHLRKNLKETKP